MAKSIDPPITGFWNIQGYPDSVCVDGSLFRKAVMQQPYDGVVAQYREDVAQNSRHMKVMSDRTWRIDHVDEDNPDRGRWLEHFFNDHPLGALAALGLCVVGGAVLLRAIARG